MMMQVFYDCATIAWAHIPKNVCQNGVNLESASRFVTNGKLLGLFCPTASVKKTRTLDLRMMKQVLYHCATIAWAHIPKNVCQMVNLESAYKIVTNEKPLGLFCPTASVK